jgi:hypothetical protein
MKRFRKYPIIIINILLILLMVKVYFFDPISDTNGAFSLFTLFALVCFNVYAIFLHIIFANSSNRYIEALFYILLLLPFFCLYYVSIM